MHADGRTLEPKQNTRTLGMKNKNVALFLSGGSASTPPACNITLLVTVESSLQGAAFKAASNKSHCA